MLALRLAVTLGILCAIAAHYWGAAAEPRPWVDELRNQNANVCCFNYDGQRLEDPEWTAGDPYRVVRGSAFVDVPPWAVVTMRNQDGIARVWWNTTPDDTGNYVRCFLPGSLS